MVFKPEGDAGAREATNELQQQGWGDDRLRHTLSAAAEGRSRSRRQRGKM
ncbi:MAG: hypothetical protein VKO00_05975 [Cyanobacteriota bacterium]|nr:hypothetical protein [Cyanobacteriota bacterium]